VLAPARQGLRTLEGGRWIEYGPDVLDKKAEIETRWPELKCVFDQVDCEWSIVQTNYNGEQSLALGQTFKCLDDRLIRRLERADERSPSVEDLEESVDRFNAQRERDDERIWEDISGDAAERLMHALRKDGIMDHDDIYGPKPKNPMIHNRAVRHSELG
jgi:hypothetical protein